MSVPRSTRPENRAAFDKLLKSPRVKEHLESKAREIAAIARDTARARSKDANKPWWRAPRYVHVPSATGWRVITADTYAVRHDRKYNTLTKIIHKEAKGGS